jgi:Fe-Mn family superoxide dismutase
MSTTQTAPFEVAPLPYAYNALEPSIDAKTMELHHDKHHKAYVTKLNDALQGHPDLQKLTLHELLANQCAKVPAGIRTAVRNNGGGHANHTLFWEIMGPSGSRAPVGESAKDIQATFGSFDEFKSQLANSAATRFGSGWAWLVVNQEKKLQLYSTANQDSPVMDGHTPILGVDVWEHAYYLNYQNRRPDYVTAWWHVVNWDKVEEFYKAALA